MTRDQLVVEVQYRQSLDEQLPDAPRTHEPPPTGAIRPGKDSR